MNKRILEKFLNKNNPK